MGGFDAITRHHFAASAILTLHVPDRSHNPFDLNIYRTRWPALLRNCSILTDDSYGVGIRFNRTAYSALGAPLMVRADPGDIFLFNSEYLHDTPYITGDGGSRTVFNSFVGFSAGRGAVEIYA